MKCSGECRPTLHIGRLQEPSCTSVLGLRPTIVASVFFCQQSVFAQILNVFNIFYLAFNVKYVHSCAFNLWHNAQLSCYVAHWSAAGAASDALSVRPRLGQRAQTVHGVVVDLSCGPRRRRRPVDTGRQLHAVLRQTRRRRRRVRTGRRTHSTARQGRRGRFTINEQC